LRKIKVTCDSTCDLTKALYEKYQIEAIPMGVTLGGEFRYDGVNVNASQIFDFVENTKTLPKTSAISVGEYIDIFSKYIEKGFQVLHISLSSELSLTHQNACTAANTLGNVVVIDSKNLSTGSGHLAVKAAELISQGEDIKAIEDYLLNIREKLDVSFVLQTLDYLHKGGRCSGIAAFGANIMKIRPEIEVSNGKMQVGKKYRGNLDRSISDYIKGRLEGRKDIQTDRIFITHSGVPQDTLDKAIDLVKQLQPFTEILVTTAGCTISSHCGPNCLGVLFFKK